MPSRHDRNLHTALRTLSTLDRKRPFLREHPGLVQDTMARAESRLRSLDADRNHLKRLLGNTLQKLEALAPDDPEIPTLRRAYSRRLQDSWITTPAMRKIEAAAKKAAAKGAKQQSKQERDNEALRREFYAVLGKPLPEEDSLR
jgi:hypothetical protein